MNFFHLIHLLSLCTFFLLFSFSVSISFLIILIIFHKLLVGTLTVEMEKKYRDECADKGLDAEVWKLMCLLSVYNVFSLDNQFFMFDDPLFLLNCLTGSMNNKYIYKYKHTQSHTHTPKITQTHTHTHTHTHIHLHTHTKS